MEKGGGPQKEGSNESREKETKADQIKMSDIRNDQTPGKCRSHAQLKAMLIKHPRIFHDSRAYVKKMLKFY